MFKQNLTMNSYSYMRGLRRSGSYQPMRVRSWKWVYEWHISTYQHINISSYSSHLIVIIKSQQFTCIYPLHRMFSLLFEMFLFYLTRASKTSFWVFRPYLCIHFRSLIKYFNQSKKHCRPRAWHKWDWHGQAVQWIFQYNRPKSCIEYSWFWWFTNHLPG